MKTVHIVYGPPLAGKSTFVRENMGPDDLVFDMDAVQNALCYGADHAGKPHTLGAAIALRNAFIAYLNNKRQDARGDAWVIISSASPEYFARRFFGARIEVTRLLPPLDVCLKRLELSRRQKNKGRGLFLIHRAAAETGDFDDDRARAHRRDQVDRGSISFGGRGREQGSRTY